MRGAAAQGMTQKEWTDKLVEEASKPARRPIHETAGQRRRCRCYQRCW